MGPIGRRGDSLVNVHICEVARGEFNLLSLSLLQQLSVGV
jgi:hypothetical protein